MIPGKIIVISLVIFTAACASNKPAPVINIKQAMIPAETINIEHRKALAQENFQQQDYHASLTQWRILRAIDPENPEYINRIRVLEALIKRRIKQFLADGKESLASNNLLVAENNLLHALALDPGNFFALKMMREIESRRVQQVQIAKTNKLLKKQMAKYEAENKRREHKATEVEEVSAEESSGDAGVQEVFYLNMGKEFFSQRDWSGAIREINKYLSSNKSTPEIRLMLSKSHANMSSMFDERGHWDPAILHLTEAIENSDSEIESHKLSIKRDILKRKAAEKYYVEGVKVYRDNVDSAIIFWKQALLHNPRHDKAENRLKKAEQIKQNLQTITQ